MNRENVLPMMIPSPRSGESLSGSELMTNPDGNETESPATNTSEFEEFWAKYPRKVGKLKARVAYSQIIGRGKSVLIDGERVPLRASHAEIMAGLKRFISGMYNSRTGEILEETKFIPHATTWLNQGRWEDGE